MFKQRFYKTFLYITWFQAVSSVVGFLVEAYLKDFGILGRNSGYLCFLILCYFSFWVGSWLLISLLLKVNSELAGFFEMV